ncbi:MAG: TonB-dependent receptor, partial [Bacteroidota bacterium]
MKPGILLFCFVFLFAFQSLAQMGTINGTVKDKSNQTLVGATVSLEGASKGAFTDLEGNFVIDNIEPGQYKILVTYVGFETVSQGVTVAAGQTITVNFTMGVDALKMDEIVISGIQDNRTKIESSVAITTLDPEIIEQRNPRGTGELLNAVPGTHVDNSSGEVAAQIFARGLATSLQSQTGYHYVSLQEDGLPVLSSEIQFSIFDMYHRPDATVGRFEALRGGSASIASANAPGGIFNFISKEGTDTPTGLVKLQAGVQGPTNPVARIDINLGGPMTKGWYYNVGGFYRFDEGARNLPYNANVGGQIKGNMVKRYDKGNIKFYAKYLNDKVTRFEFLPVSDLETLTPFGDFDLNTSALYPELLAENMPDGERFLEDPNATRSFDSNLGISTRNYAMGINLVHNLGKTGQDEGWIIRNNFKYSYISQDYSQYAGNIVFDPENAMNEFLGLPAFFANLFTDYQYADLATGEVLYSASQGIDNVDKFYAGAGFTITNRIHDVLNQFVITKKAGRHQLGFGAYGSYAFAEPNWTGEGIISTLEANPRNLVITHVNPFAPNDPDVGTFYYTNPETGILSEGGAVYNRSTGSSAILSFFFTDLWEVNERLNIDFGLRWENVFHDGENEAFEFASNLLPSTDLNPLFALPDGPDGDFATWYDSGTRIGTGEFNEYNFTYGYWSGSLGINYKIKENLAVYGRGTRGVKAPEIGYYINNFVNQPIERGIKETIYMGEIGLKVKNDIGSIFMTGFISQMNDVNFQLFIPGENASVLFTPSTFNTIRTIGLELESITNPVKNLFIKLIMTLQDPRFVEFDYYNVNGTSHPVFIGETYPQGVTTIEGFSDFVDQEGNAIVAGAESDDFIESFDGNKVKAVPSIISDLTVSYKISRFNVYANWRYTGKRFGN